ncbi:MAG: hypothetical protein IKN24_06690 [Lachnospiraceae bacterium]|nr:hypothetical protein [Lachnospiraceae bacterium]
MARNYYNNNKNESSVVDFYRRGYRDTQYETYGNTVREVVRPLPEEQDEYDVRPKRPARRSLTREEQKKMMRAKSFNLPSIIVIAIFMIAAAYSCFLFVGAQGELNKHLSNVKALRSELQTITERNDIRLNDVETGIDYTEIYDYAITQLGMSQPRKDQVVWYDATESEYVVQYEKIPTQ